MFNRLKNVFQPARLRAEIEEEFHHHLDSRIADNIAAGMNPAAARTDARRRFGSASLALEQTWEARIFVWTGTILQDLRYAFRMLSRHPTFTAVAVLALALGIGVNTAVFTAYRAILARPLDARDPARMVNFALTRDSGSVSMFSYPDYETYRDSIHSATGLIAFSSEQMTLSRADGIAGQRASGGSKLGGWGLLPSSLGNAESAGVSAVSENYFRVLGIPLLRGRAFDSLSPEEILASPPALISANYWETRFANDPAIIGRGAFLNDMHVTIIGITPRNFIGTGLAIPDFWLPMSVLPQVHSEPRWLTDRERPLCRIFARLAPGVTISQAQAEMTIVYDRLRTLHDPRSDWTKRATILVWPGSPFPLPIEMYGALRFAILLIMVAAGMVLVVACANVGSLQLARARSRENELNTRTSIGAGRARLVRQLLTESILLSLLAGASALLFAWVFLRLGVVEASQMLPQDFGTLYYDVTPDVRIFVYVSVISLVAGILFGLVPAMESSRAALSGAVRSATASLRGRRIQDFLVAAQVALSLVLLIAGSMLIRSSLYALNADNGYDKSVIDLTPQFPDRDTYTPARRRALIDDMRARIAALPGTTAVTSGHSPAEPGYRTIALALDSAHASFLNYTFVQENYFRTLGIPVLMGRTVRTRSSQPEHSVVLSQSAAARLWPGESPVGRTLRLGPTDEKVHNDSELHPDGPAWQVVGVVRDTRGGGFGDSDSIRVYLPVPENRIPGQPLLIRTQSDPAKVIHAIDPLLSSIDPDLPATATTLDEMLRVEPRVASAATAAIIASFVGLLGLLLALMGIYGTVCYIVALRTREVGIRMAIGAEKREVLLLIMRESARPVVVGVSAGILLAAGVSRLLRGLLFGLPAIDGVSFVGVSLLFLAVALIASFPPSLRATHVAPAVALRCE